MFQDITTLLLDIKAFRDTIDLFVERYQGKDISVVAGISANLSIILLAASGVFYCLTSVLLLFYTTM